MYNQTNQELSLGIIITTYNSSNMIKTCLENIDFSHNFEVIVVDNASTDNTTEIISKNFPQVKIIKNSSNLGFSRANNIALKELQKDFALILNVDAVISFEDIKKTLKIMAQNNDVAIAGNIVHNCTLEDGKIKHIAPCPKNQQQLTSATQNILFYINKFVTGAGMFLNMKIMREVGFFDEGFFLYCEDNEICKRVIKIGYKTAIIKDTKLIHIGGLSSKITLGEREKIYWHRFGWSKLYYTQQIYGKSIAIIKALRMILKFSIVICKEKLINNQIPKKDSQALKGCLAYICGLGAFDKNDIPRG